ncbi:hypothetical protein PV325_009832 [Microctonus aethiopoides]|nr:hypothetical protein PV325_009832 [Microctonus aethiopoides]
MQQHHQQFFIISFVLCSIIAVSFAAPIHYDQRQDGQLNVHANLENFVIIIAPISDTPSTSSQAPPDLTEFSLTGLLEAFESRKNLIKNNKLEHKNEKKNIEAIPEVLQNYSINEEEHPKETRSLKTKPAKKKVTGITELTLIGDSIENCGPGRIRDRSGICQFDSSSKNQ